MTEAFSFALTVAGKPIHHHSSCDQNATSFMRACMLYPRPSYYDARAVPAACVINFPGPTCTELARGIETVSFFTVQHVLSTLIPRSSFIHS